MGPNPIGPVFLLEEEEKPESSQAFYTEERSCKDTVEGSYPQA